ncbi:MAG: CvpA family protein [Deltaproteobacteria bacterium]|nr:CvpA family protein [Deltaproteobacteria bacterium]
MSFLPGSNLFWSVLFWEWLNFSSSYVLHLVDVEADLDNEVNLFLFVHHGQIFLYGLFYVYEGCRNARVRWWICGNSIIDTTEYRRGQSVNKHRSIFTIHSGTHIFVLTNSRLLCYKSYMNLLDYIIIITMVYLIVKGVFRGFMREIASLAGIVLGIVFGILFLPEMTNLLKPYLPSTQLLPIISLAIISRMVRQGSWCLFCHSERCSPHLFCYSNTCLFPCLPDTSYYRFKAGPVDSQIIPVHGQSHLSGSLSAM